MKKKPVSVHETAKGLDFELGKLVDACAAARREMPDGLHWIAGKLFDLRVNIADACLGVRLKRERG